MYNSSYIHMREYDGRTLIVAIRLVWGVLLVAATTTEPPPYVERKQPALHLW